METAKTLLARLLDRHPALGRPHVRAETRQLALRVVAERDPIEQVAVLEEPIAAVAAARALLQLALEADPRQGTSIAELLDELDRAALDPAQGDRVTPVPPSRGGLPGSILIIEDDEASREAIRDVLQQEGHSVYTAQHGADALQKLATVRPSLILLDLMMPVMNGWQFLTELRGDPSTADIPVAVMSTARNAEQARCDRFLTKPIDLDAVLALCNEVRRPIPRAI